MHNKPQLFHPQAEAALADKELRANFRGAMDYLRDKRKTAFADADEEQAIRHRPGHHHLLQHDKRPAQGR